MSSLPSESSEENDKSHTGDETAPLLPWTGREQDSCGLSARYTVVAVLALGLCINYFQRSSLSVAMVAMVTENATNVPIATGNSSGTGCPKLNSTSSGKAIVHGEFPWQPATQGLILSSFFYGYIALQTARAWLATRYGFKLVIGSSMFVASIFSLLIPIAARFHYGSLIAVRVLQGVGSSAVYPCTIGLIGRWAPVNERARMTSFIIPGVHLGTVGSFLLTGWLCEQTFLGGWPSAFYLAGIAGCIWVVIWIILIYDSPHKHPRISKSEFRLITSSQNRPVGGVAAVPWKSIFTSRAFWAISVAHTCNNWGSYTLQTQLPSYLKNIIGVGVSRSGFLSALPYIVAAPLVMAWASLADLLRKREILSATNVRKLMNLIGTLGPGSLLVVSTMVGCNQYEVIAVITSAIALMTAHSGGTNPNIIDIAPYFAGVIKGVVNTFSTLAGMVGPYVAGLIVNKEQTKAAWTIVFYISAGIFIFDGLFYSALASSELAPWGTFESEVFVEPSDKQTNERTDKSNTSKQEVWAGNVQKNEG